ncbi:MAG: MarR family transcriptional regulator [Gemmatimonas sp.]|nr:MarR family transcriptional regulator [Gemmatimonas sp.]
MTSCAREEDQPSRPFICLEQEAFLKLGRTWAVLEHAFSEGLKEHGITPTQYNVLRILREVGERGLCRGEVTQRMIAKVPDATRLLDRLEVAGLIERERASADRRFVTTRITTEGLQVLAELDGPVEALHREHFGKLGENDLRRLIDLLGRVRTTL